MTAGLGGTPTRFLRLDPAAIAASFAANRIASQLEIIATLSCDERFVLQGDTLKDVLGLVAIALHDWIVTMGSLSAPADLRRETHGLRLAAEALFALLRLRANLPTLAERSRDWANSVQGWARLSGSMAL